MERHSFPNTIVNPLNDRGGSAMKIDGSRRFYDKFLGKPTAGDCGRQFRLKKNRLFQRRFFFFFFVNVRTRDV